MRIKFLLLPAAIALAVSSCKDKTETTAKKDFLAEDIDSSISPAKDFFEYANGGWIKRNPIPADESSWGVGNLVQEDIYNRLKKINDDASAKKAAEGTIEQKIGDFWYSGMDTVDIEKQGIQPLKEKLDEINSIKNSADLINVVADLHRLNTNVMFGDYVGQDDKNSEVMAYQLGQGGLGMPNRDYYFNTDARTVGIRKGYQDYLEKTFVELGNDSSAAKKITKSVFDLETRLAKSSRKLAALRDPEKNYNKISVDKLTSLCSNFNWPVYLQKIGITKLDSTIVGQPEFFSNLSTEIKITPIDVWKNYLKFHLIRASAPYLDSKTFTNYFDYLKLLTGALQPRPRWKRVLDAEERSMGEALGQLFVKQYFSEKAKKRYTDLVEAIRDAYKDRIKNLTWMSDSTKQKALDKLSKITPKVGYPDKWKDFSAMKIGRVPFVINMESAAEWWHNYNINKLGKPVDR
ncbi:MAG TPA: M13 family metallopeptidase N-terminal domain-containing protein, partial [Chitinophagaceae bacterium]|nr:M13 family metallopeptidase N-terminal domain-containing protein [Chitinophagaceae bacterium]